MTPPPLRSIDPQWMTATQISHAVQSGAITARAVTEVFLDRASQMEPEIAAFAHLAPEVARAAADRIDAQPHKGPLAGVPLGIKDVFDTADIPTAYGSAAYAGHQPRADASAVHLARRAGAVALGKTVTTEFATMSPGPTRNPHHLAHTPGGSSSGSAAALAAGSCLLAFGTQTSGSTIRPAAYCGVVGVKLGPRRIDRTGVKTLAESLDVVGIMARNTSDAALFAATCARRPDWLIPIDNRVRYALFLPDQPGETICDRYAAALEDTASTLGAVPHKQPGWWADLGAAQEAVFAWEASAALAYERDCLNDLLTPITRDFTARHQKIANAQAYQDGLIRRDQALEDLEALFGTTDLLLTPSAPSAAPEGIRSTGPADYNIRWTLLGLPSLSLPIGFDRNGLPFGMQLVARPGQDHLLLQAAIRIETELTAKGLRPALALQS
ncbi:amidase (plasmid) [Thioclava sp. 'Guangxiensis']|uniref:amidase n=1 Tax=Thioclava sp. 'Guangxiensis' TaxID=3149044 RepID=UPI0032C40DBE